MMRYWMSCTAHTVHCWFCTDDVHRTLQYEDNAKNGRVTVMCVFCQHNVLLFVDNGGISCCGDEIYIVLLSGRAALFCQLICVCTHKSTHVHYEATYRTNGIYAVFRWIRDTRKFSAKLIFRDRFFRRFFFDFKMKISWGILKSGVICVHFRNQELKVYRSS